MRYFNLNYKFFTIILLCFSTSIYGKPSQFKAEVDELAPLFEWGLLIGHGLIPDYPASNEYKNLTIPIPYLNYRGEILKSDDQEGTRVEILSNKRFNLDFSFGGTFPTESEKNIARRGMPALDWTIEVGPRILYYLYREPSFGKFRITLPLRSSFSTDFQRLKQVGFLWAPGLELEKFDFINENMNLYLDAQVNYLSRGLASYFYQVEDQYTNGERGAWQARDGFWGWESSFGVKYEDEKKIFLFGARYSDFNGSVNSDSYLHRTDSSWSYLIGIGWILFRSETMAQH
jgi:outer membrane protein